MLRSFTRRTSRWHQQLKFPTAGFNGDSDFELENVGGM